MRSFRGPAFLTGTGFLTFAALLIFCAPTAHAQSSTPQTTPEVQELESRISTYKAQLKDWPNLTRYREANSKVVPPAKGENRVVFMGDSITDWWERRPEMGGFFPGKPYIDRGISGQTTPQMLVRFRADVLALQPKVVVILAGTNDIAGNTGPESLEEIEGYLTSMVQLAQVNKIKVVLASVTPVSDYGHGDDGKPVNMTNRRPPQSILTLNTWIKKFAAENHCTYLDYFSAMVDAHGFLKNELSPDGLHPNAAGYAVMAPLAESAIQSALKSK